MKLIILKKECHVEKSLQRAVSFHQVVFQGKINVVVDIIISFGSSTCLSVVIRETYSRKACFKQRPAVHALTRRFWPRLKAGIRYLVSETESD